MADENFIIQIVLRARDEMAQAINKGTNAMRGMNREVGRTQQSMAGLDSSSQKTVRSMRSLGSEADKTRGRINAIRGPTESVRRAISGLGSTVDRTNRSLTEFNRKVHTNRESIAKFDNEIRGLRLLVVFAQFQALTSAVIGLSGALTGLVGSAISAGTALGGALAAGAAQAVPAVGLLGAAVARLKAVFDVVGQAQQAQQAEATRATTANNAQADSVDRLASAQDTLKNANESMADAQKGVNEARKQGARDLQDLILAEQRARLETAQAEDRLRQLRSSGTTGFELQSAELDVAEQRLQQRRTVQEARTARRQGVAGSEGVQDARRSLRDAQQQLEAARRGLEGARRDSAEGGAATVAAARQLQYLEGQLTAAERRLVDSIERIQDTWKDVSRPITDTIVEAFTRGVDRSERALRDPKLGRAFQDLADSGAKQMDRITNFSTSNRSLAFFTRQTKELAINLQPAGTGAIRLSRAFQNVADNAAPTLRRMVVDFAQLSGSIERASENDRGLREMFRYGEIQLHAWFDLAKAIGRTIAAIVAPGGDLNRGAAASGLRTLVDLTERFNDAADWLNDNPWKVDEFFGESEEVFQRLLDLAILLAKHLFNLFEPGTVDAFADIIENLLPPFEHAVRLLGDLTQAFAALMNVPGLREAMQLAFGLVVFARIGGRIQALLLGFVGPLSTMVTLSAKWLTGLGAAATTLGGITARIHAARAAMAAFGTTAATANRAVAATGAVPVVARAPIGVNQPRGPDGRFIPAVAAAGGAAGAGRFAGARGAFAGAGPAIAITAALSALISGATAGGGPGQRLRGAASGATFGLLSPDAIRGGADSGIGRFIARSGGPIAPLANLLGSSREDRLRDRAGDTTEKLREAFKDKDVEAVRRYRIELSRMANEAKEFGDEDLAGDLRKVANGATRAEDALDRFTTTAGKKITFDRDDIRNGFWVNNFTRNLARLNTEGVSSVQDLRTTLDNNMESIADGFKKNSKAAADATVMNFTAGTRAVSRAINEGRIDADAGFKEIARITRRQMTFAARHMDELSGKGRDALATNFGSARRAVKNQMDRAEITVEQGMKRINKLLAMELEAFGVDKKTIRQVMRQGPGDANEAFMLAGRAGGGFVGHPGERGADTGMYRLGRGEAVLNWAHQKVVNPAMQAYYGFGLPDMFNKIRGAHAGDPDGRGFAKGGIVPVPGFPGEQAATSILDEIAYYTKKYGLRLTDAYGPGHESAGHTIYGTNADLSGPDKNMNAATREMVRRGYRVLYDAGTVPGSITYPGHGPSSVAGDNAHIHVEFDSAQGGESKGKFSASGKDVKDFKIPRVRITGSGANSALGAIIQGATDVAREAAQKAGRKAARRAGGGAEGSEPGKGGQVPPGNLRTWLRKALEITNQYSPGNLSALYGRAMQESGGNPRAINNWDSNAAAGTPSKGVLQTIDPTFNAYKMKGMGNIWNPIHNAVAAIRYMLARYGHIVGPSSTGYAKGGIIEDEWPEGTPMGILAHSGEWVLNKTQQMRAAMMAGLSPKNLSKKLFNAKPKGENVDEGYARGGIVGDSLGVGTDNYLDGFIKRTQGGASSGMILKFLLEMLKKNPKLDKIIFDAGTNDSNPEVLKRNIQKALRAAGDRQVIIPTVGGPNAGAKNEVIRSFGDRDNVDIFNWRQFAQKNNLLSSDNIHAAGGNAYKRRAAAISKLFGGGGSGGGSGEAGTGGFELPDLMPDDLKGLLDVTRDLFKHVKSLKDKGEDRLKKVNANFDVLTRDGGLLDALSAAIEKQTTNMANRALRAQFRIRDGRVVRVRGDVFESERSLAGLRTTGRGLRAIDRQIGRGLRGVNQGIRGLRRGGIDDDEEDILLSLQTQRRNFTNRRLDNRGLIAENLQSRFEGQQGLIESRMARALRPLLQGAARTGLGQRISEAFGRGGQAGFIDQNVANLADQRVIVNRFLQRAKRQRNTELTEQLREQLQDIDGQLAELVSQRLQAQVDDANRAFSRSTALIDFRDRLANATGTLGLNSLIPGGGATRAQGFAARDAAIRGQLGRLGGLAQVAQRQGNIGVLDDLNQSIRDLIIELTENSRQLFLARIDDVNRRLSNIQGQSGTRGRIAELQAELGIITGPESQQRQIAEANIVGGALRTQAAGLAQLLAEARTRRDEEQIALLEQAVLDNTLAQLENSKTLKELDGSLNQTQSFSSTAWQWFRTAIFNGSGGLMPGFAMNYQSPSFGIGGGAMMPVAAAAAATSLSTMGAGGGTLVNVEVNEAGQVPDPVYLGNRIALATKTPGT